MTNLYDGLAADLLQNSGKYNPEARALSYAILQEKRRVMDKVQQTRTMAMIDELPEPVLDVLAVELRTPAYSESYPADIKRTLIKGTLAFYAKLGTPEAVNWVIRSIFGNGQIEEWYDYGGDPHHFKVAVRNDGSFNSLNGLEDFMRLVTTVKRLSSWLDEITVVTDLGTATLHIGGCMAAMVKLPIPEIADTFNFTNALRVGGRMASTVRLPVPALQDDITLSCTGRVGVTGAVIVTVPLPEIP